ncbi:hypothetical protein IQ264_26430 [Phormidium sp. LEGE 05292]|uniref:hypothetical protein n=1 Tax=[Phormidium] sp. LEGE 05292 TaxID=767427 RepID=UPI00188231A0|nr:hypothetical protein [Phormidium sp. LEGE 05292]MBE9228953.1 hypothetical protein [Phormidium sp. LEGE 05292]
MKRKISLLLALTLSFLMMFGSIAKAEEIKVPISVSTSESTKLEVVKNPVAKTNEADCPPPQAQASEQVLEEVKQVGNGITKPLQCTLPCPPSGRLGYWNGYLCVICDPK